MSTYVRVRKAERLHWIWATIGAFVVLATLAAKLYTSPSAVDLNAFPLTLACATLPLLTLGLSGRFYRWSREGGQSRWMALFPAVTSVGWILLSAMIVVTLSSGVPAESVWMAHGTAALVFGIGSGAIAVNRLSTRRKARPRFGEGPTSADMDALIASVTHAVGDSSTENSALETILEGLRKAEWKTGSPAVEEVAGALLALRTVLESDQEPGSRALQDSIELVERTLARASH